MNEVTRTRLRRLPDRAVRERPEIDAILDEAIVCHLGFVADGHPVVTPTLAARVNDHVYVHGSAASRTVRALGQGVEVCLTVTLVDGLVLARGAFHHSVNYRSVMVFGRAEPFEDPDEKLRALEAFTDKLAPGRWADVRPPTRQELKGTTILRIPLEEVSAKARTGPPGDDEEDYALDVWAGVVPITTVRHPPVPDPRLPAGVALPAYLAGS
jgi:nitroimidazol reductase NimA-like FMN-containing flavoprotein (pyridoxamine 5'-phosphate oxidase superfamily)